MADKCLAAHRDRNAFVELALTIVSNGLKERAYLYAEMKGTLDGSNLSSL